MALVKIASERRNAIVKKSKKKLKFYFSLVFPSILMGANAFHFFVVPVRRQTPPAKLWFATFVISVLKEVLFSF
ncbi:MAG: hypothetical protein LE180_06065 [Endomicrobium sp.]|nr:hypothetical protein [Endomicrobium sp.]